MTREQESEYLIGALAFIFGFWWIPFVSLAPFAGR